MWGSGIEKWQTKKCSKYSGINLETVIEKTTDADLVWYVDKYLGIHLLIL